MTKSEFKKELDAMSWWLGDGDKSASFWWSVVEQYAHGEFLRAYEREFKMFKETLK